MLHLYIIIGSLVFITMSVVGVMVYLLVWNSTSTTPATTPAEDSTTTVTEQTDCDTCNDCTDAQTCIYNALTSLRTLSELKTVASHKQIGHELNGTASQSFGYSVHTNEDGSRIIVGANQHSSYLGTVKIYDYNSTTLVWDQVGDQIDGAASSDRCGEAVNITPDGTRIAIGSPYNSSSFGHVRIYDYDAEAEGKWTQVGSTISGSEFSRFGTSVSLSADGTRVAIGAPHFQTNRGSASVYEWNGSAWALMGSAILGDASDNQSYVCLSGDGTTLLTSSFANTSGDGRARVYRWNGSAWAQLGASITGTLGAAEAFGFYLDGISADGNRIAVGASDANNYGGLVRIYDYNGTAWEQVGSDISRATDADEWVGFGYGVSLSSSGNRVAIGADGVNGPAGYDQGIAAIYELIGGEWLQSGVDILGENIEDYSGVPLSLSRDGTRVVVGAASNEDAGTAAGQVRVFDVAPYSALTCFDTLI